MDTLQRNETLKSLNVPYWHTTPHAVCDDTWRREIFFTNKYSSVDRTGNGSFRHSL